MKVLTTKNQKVLNKLAKICLEDRLYVQGRLAKNWFQKPSGIEKMSVSFYNKKLIGWAMLYNSDYYLHEGKSVLGVFIKPSFRKLGIGSKLIKNVSESHMHVPKHKFFLKLGLCA